MPHLSKYIIEMWFVSFFRHVWNLSA